MTDYYSKINICNFSNATTARIATTDEIDAVTIGEKGYFYPYQIDMWNKFKNAVEDYKNGKEEGFLFVAGTGTGKTEIFKFISPYLISKAEAEENKEGKVFGIVCHRLCLIKDLGSRIIPTMLNDYSDNSDNYWNAETLAGCGIPKNKIKFYYVNSGEKITFMDNAIKKVDGCHVNRYTKDELDKEIEENKKNGIHSCFICLYQSIKNYGNTLLKDIRFDWLICDEIHSINGSSEKEYTLFDECAKFFRRNGMKFYFTATPQYDAKDTRQGE